MKESLTSIIIVFRVQNVILNRRGCEIQVWICNPYSNVFSSNALIVENTQKKVEGGEPKSYCILSHYFSCTG